MDFGLCPDFYRKTTCRNTVFCNFEWLQGRRFQILWTPHDRHPVSKLTNRDDTPEIKYRYQQLWSYNGIAFQPRAPGGVKRGTSIKFSFVKFPGFDGSEIPASFSMSESRGVFFRVVASIAYSCRWCTGFSLHILWVLVFMHTRHMLNLWFTHPLTFFNFWASHIRWEKNWPSQSVTWFTWKWHPGRGDTFWKASCSGSMLDFGGLIPM